MLEAAARVLEHHYLGGDSYDMADETLIELYRAMRHVESLQQEMQRRVAARTTATAALSS